MGGMPEGTPRQATPGCCPSGCRSTTSERSTGRTVSPLARRLPFLRNTNEPPSARSLQSALQYATIDPLLTGS